MAFIYKITNTITADIYIGKTGKSLQTRMRQHIYNSKCGLKTGLYRAFRKYGPDKFKMDILEEVSTDLADHKERFYIKQLNPKYNMTKGGDGGDTASSPNFIKAMKEYHSKKDKASYATYGMLGKECSSQTRKRISEKNSYPVMCDNTRYESIIEAQKAYPNTSIRKRIDSPRYPNFYRLRPKRVIPR